MINKIFIIITLAVCLNLNVFSQAIGLEGKRFSVDLSISESVFNKYHYMVFSDGMVNSYQQIYKSFFLPAFRANGSLNYTIGRKSSVGLLFSGSVNKFKDVVYDEEKTYGGGNFRGFRFSLGSVSYYGVGLQYSISTKDFISPVGSTVSFYAKYNLVSVKNYVYNNGYDIDANNKDILIQDSTSLKMNYYNIGITWNKMSFLSNKIPLYLKYGAGMGATIKKRYRVGEETEKYSRKEIRNSKYSIQNEINLAQLTTYYTVFELVQLHVGIGYIF